MTSVADILNAISSFLSDLLPNGEISLIVLSAIVIAGAVSLVRRVRGLFR